MAFSQQFKPNITAANQGAGNLRFNAATQGGRKVPVGLKDGSVANLDPKPQTAKSRPNAYEQSQIRTNAINTYQDNLDKTTQDALNHQYNVQGRGGLGSDLDFNESRRNYQTYKYDYFCGSQAKVFFGDIWVDDIVTIQYNIRQTKEPIYGYASQNYDAMAMGTVLGEGTLVVSFKETGYLNVIKAFMQEQQRGVRNAAYHVANRLSNGAEGQGYTTSDYAAVVSPNYNPALIRQSETIEDALDNIKAARRQDDQIRINRQTNGNVDFSSTASHNDDNIKDFEDAAEVLEDIIWGDSNGKPLSAGLEARNGLLRADEFDYKRNRQNEPIGIKVATNGYEDAFNIILTFGDLTDYRAEHTIQALNDVHFTGQSMMINPNGEPIGEVYNFIFRDINKTVNKTTFNINPVAFNIGQDDDFVVSKRQFVEDLLNPYENINIYLTFKSGFKNGAWTPINVSLDPNSVGMPMLNIDPARGLHGSLYKYIEDTLFNYLTTNRDDKNIESYERLAISVYSTIGFNAGMETPTAKIQNNALSDQDARSASTFNIIAEQQGFSGSVAYKVIAPGTNDYAALDLVRREDFFRAAPVTPYDPDRIVDPVPRDPIIGRTNNFVPPSGNLTAPDLTAEQARQANAAYDAARRQEQLELLAQRTGALSIPLDNATDAQINTYERLLNSITDETTAGQLFDINLQLKFLKNDITGVSQDLTNPEYSGPSLLQQNNGPLSNNSVLSSNGLGTGFQVSGPLVDAQIELAKSSQLRNDLAGTLALSSELNSAYLDGLIAQGERELAIQQGFQNNLLDGNVAFESALKQQLITEGFQNNILDGGDQIRLANETQREAELRNLFGADYLTQYQQKQSIVTNIVNTQPQTGLSIPTYQPEVPLIFRADTTGEIVTDISTALDPIGYQWGAKQFDTNGTLDCSGYAVYINNQLAQNFPQQYTARDANFTNANALYEQSVPVAANAVQPGDVAFLRDESGRATHVVVFAGYDSNGEPLLTDSRSGEGVITQRVRDAYFANRLTGWQTLNTQIIQTTNNSQ